MDTRTQTQTHNNDGVATLAVLHRKLKGGYVKRYHTRPELADNQDVAAHSWRATVLLHTLCLMQAKSAYCICSTTTYPRAN
jgi:hypothetical protein